MSDRLERSIALMDAKADVKMIKERANECWYDTKILANAVYLILDEIMADRKTETQTECTGCRFVGSYDTQFPCANCARKTKDYYDSPQTERSE